jgi:hypothetical protein
LRVIAQKVNGLSYARKFRIDAHHVREDRAKPMLLASVQDDDDPQYGPGQPVDVELWLVRTDILLLTRTRTGPPIAFRFWLWFGMLLPTHETIFYSLLPQACCPIRRKLKTRFAKRASLSTAASLRAACTRIAVTIAARQAG